MRNQSLVAFARAAAAAEAAAEPEACSNQGFEAATVVATVLIEGGYSSIATKRPHNGRYKLPLTLQILLIAHALPDMDFVFCCST